ncbi:MAG: transaldolase, partial [Cardiobacteriaceae bacterium]|nr:transaldolase [Cardiobacteriaceae bacterium]
AVEDIRKACDLMLPVFEKTGGTDGMVSLEVSPDLAHDTEKTVAEAMDLYHRVARENVMIKVPATLAGIEAIRRLTAEGINTNATLLFSPVRYQQVFNAYIDGLKVRVSEGQSVDFVRSVASFFVSRVDSKVDSLLTDEHADLRGRAAIANAEQAYAYYLERVSHEDWIDLAKKGAAIQRLLWASTGTKNPDYSDVRYVELLIGRDTVNTIPPDTYQAFKDHGRAEETLLRNLDSAPQVLQQVSNAGVDWTQVYEELEAEGITAFEQAFATLLTTLSKKIRALRKAINADVAQAAAEEAALVEINEDNKKLENENAEAATVESVTSVDGQSETSVSEASEDEGNRNLEAEDAGAATVESVTSVDGQSETSVSEVSEDEDNKKPKAENAEAAAIESVSLADEQSETSVSENDDSHA